MRKPMKRSSPPATVASPSARTFARALCNRGQGRRSVLSPVTRKRRPTPESRVPRLRNLWRTSRIPIQSGTEGSGCHFRSRIVTRSRSGFVRTADSARTLFVAVGGDYTKSNAAGTAIWSIRRRMDMDRSVTAAAWVPVHGGLVRRSQGLDPAGTKARTSPATTAAPGSRSTMATGTPFRPPSSSAPMAASRASTPPPSPNLNPALALRRLAAALRCPGAFEVALAIPCRSDNALRGPARSSFDSSNSNSSSMNHTADPPQPSSAQAAFGPHRQWPVPGTIKYTSE